MRYLKMFGLLAVAGAALMAFAASASATTITSPTGTSYTGTIEAENENGHVKLVGPLNINIQCNSFVKGEVEKHSEEVGGVTQPASGPIEELTFTGCTNGYTAKVINNNFGSLKINSAGALTSFNTEVTVTTPLGFNCIYRTAAAGTAIGTVTDSHDTGGAATLDINAAPIPRTGHSAFCGSSGEWNGNYVATNPSTLYVD